MSGTRTVWRITALIAFAVTLLSGVDANARPKTAQWLPAWTASIDRPGRSFNKVTIRQVVHLGLGGGAVRVRLSNLLGDRPLRIGAAGIAIAAPGGRLAGANIALRFKGRSDVTIPIGKGITSDPVRLRVAAFDDVSVSLFLPQETGPSTGHTNALQTGYVGPGDLVSIAAPQWTTTITARHVLTDVEVLRQDGPFIVAAFGDSITDGTDSAIDTNRRWPDILAQRLAARCGSGRTSILNAGIAGNRLLHDTIGRRGVDRLDRDVLSHPGLGAVIVALGINDIGFPGLGLAQEEVSATQIQAALRDIAARIHRRGLRVIVATLMPFQDTRITGYYTAAGDAKRHAVNDWIRRAAIFDAVVDFDLALRDQAQPARLRADFDSGDHLHPNDKGHAALARSIDLDRLLLKNTCVGASGRRYRRPR